MSTDGGPADNEQLLVELAQLREALEWRDVIGQAKGIIRLLTQCDSEEAFAVLSRVSQETNYKLRDVAALIAECAATGAALPADVSACWRRLVLTRPTRP